MIFLNSVSLTNYQTHTILVTETLSERNIRTNYKNNIE